MRSTRFVPLVASLTLASAVLVLPRVIVKAQTAVTVNVNVAASRRPIDPRIYGVNFATPQQLAALNVPLNRWGGNSTTRYNWQNDTSNRASDWFFENIPNDNANPGALPHGSSMH